MAAAKKPRATPERWTFKAVTNDGKTRIESAGPIDPELGAALRVLQVHITRLSPRERDVLCTLTEQVLGRAKAEAKL